MDMFPGLDSGATLSFALAVGLFAGLVKGAVGFAMPMVLISGLSLVLAPDLALAALIIPTLATNFWQAVRQGPKAALQTIVTYRVFLVAGLVLLLCSAQLVRSLDIRLLFALIGLPVTAFAVMQLAGWRLRLARRSTMAEVCIGGFAGFIGGVSGVWGPPTVAYLTAIDTPKQEHFRTQGAIYSLGAVALTLAHIHTGVLRAETVPLGLLILPAALSGMVIGLRIQDRISHSTFRTATLIVLVFAGLNLMRRAVFS